MGQNNDDYRRFLLGLEEGVDQNDLGQRLISQLRFNGPYNALYMAMQSLEHAATLKETAGALRKKPFGDDELALAVGYITHNPGKFSVGSPKRRQAQQGASELGTVLQALYDEEVVPGGVQTKLSKEGGVEGLLARRAAGSSSEEDTPSDDGTGSPGEVEEDPAPLELNGVPLLREAVGLLWSEQVAAAFHDLPEGYCGIYIYKWAPDEDGHSQAAALHIIAMAEKRVPLSARLPGHEEEEA